MSAACGAVGLVELERTRVKGRVQDGTVEFEFNKVVWFRGSRRDLHSVVL